MDFLFRSLLVFGFGDSESNHTLFGRDITEGLFNSSGCGPLVVAWSTWQGKLIVARSKSMLTEIVGRNCVGNSRKEVRNCVGEIAWARGIA